MSATVNSRQLHNCGPTTPCPGCKATVYVGTMKNGRCVLCNLKPRPQTALERAIEEFARQLEGVK